MEEYLPNEWMDEERMIVLMSAMPPGKESLTSQSRFNFWSSTIHKWIVAKKILSFTFHESELAFQRGTQVPLCLQDVLSYMLKNGDLMTADQLLADSNNSWLQWTKKNLLFLPSQWAWKRLKEPFSNNNLQQSTIYVDMISLKKVANNFLDEYWSTSEKKYTPIMSILELHPLLSKFISKSEDHNILLQYLSMMGKLCYNDCDGKLIVKMRVPGDLEILPISEIEIAEHHLKSALSIVDGRMKAMINEINICREDAKLLLKSGLKKQAYSKIRRKQILEKNLENLSLTQDNLIACIEKLMESEINSAVVEAFRSGLNAMQKSIASGGSSDSIEDTLDNLKEVMDECNDLTGMISSASNYTDVAEDNLEKELATLMENIDIQPPVEKPSFPLAPSVNPEETTGDAEKIII